MATMTAEQIKDEFIRLLDDNYRCWTDTENAQACQEAIRYIQGAFDLMLRCVDKLDKVGEAVKVDECGEE